MKQRILLPITALSLVSAPITVFAETGIEKITVTSRQVEETVQEVPLAITALSGDILERGGVDDLRDITQMVAGLQFDGNPGKVTTSPTIRGLSQVSRSDDENNTSVFIDGVFVSGRDGLDFSMLDLERIEVVKGPQGALYGRNAYAGAINFITKKAQDVFEAKGTVTWGNYDRKRASVMVNTPITDGLSGRVNLTYDHFGGGYENSLNGDDIGGYQSKFASAALRYEGIENLDVSLTSYYSEDLIDTPAQVIAPGNCSVPTSAIFPSEFSEFQRICGIAPEIDADDPAYFTFNTDLPAGEREISRTSLNATYDTDSFRVTSITGYNTLDTATITDQDRQLAGAPFYADNYASVVSIPTYVGFGLLKQDEWSQEIRINSTTNSALQWLVGMSYYDLNRRSRGWWGADASGLDDPSSVITFFPPIYNLTDGLPKDLWNGLAALEPVSGAGGLTGDGKSNTNTKAIYGSVNYAFTDKFTGRAELRYTKEKKTLDDDVTSRNQEASWEFLSPRLSVDYQYSDNILFYSSVAQGSKAGGFNAPNPQLPADLESYDQETNWTYEVGMKSDWMDNTLRINTALYNVEMDDIQITNQIPGTGAFAVLNGGTGRSRGLELELTALLTSNIEFNAGYALADSYFVDADDASQRALVTEGLLDSISLDGQQLPRVSKHTLNASLVFHKELTSDLDGFVQLDGRYESDKKMDNFDGLAKVDARTVANFSIGVSTVEWEAQLWVRNLFDNRTPNIAGSTLNIGDFSRLPTIGLPEPRTIGITATLRFE